MRNTTCQKWVCLMAGMAFLLILGGQALAKDGPYIAMDLGLAVGSDLDTRSSDNDSPTLCDQFINPQAMLCESANEKWSNKFDKGTGVLAGLALGYRWRNFRIEGEYFYRNASHDDSAEPDFGGGVVDIKIAQEIAESEEAIDDLLSHNFFTNLYYDFTSDSKWTSYLGVGLGVARVELDYASRFARSTDPAHIRTFKDTEYANKDDLARTLAGTTTVGRSKLSDTLFGYQAIAGLDYRISEPVTIGLKFRWADFGEFKDDDEYAQLRSHDSTNSSDSGSARVRYQIRTDDIKFWGLSLNMKYHF